MNENELPEMAWLNSREAKREVVAPPNVRSSAKIILQVTKEIRAKSPPRAWVQMPLGLHGA